MELVDQYAHFHPASDESVDDVLLADQQYFVFQLAHAETSIRSPDGKAWIRCIGFGKTLDDARDLAKRAFDAGDKMETRIMPVGRVFLAGRTKYEGLDLPRREEEQIKANKLIDEWIALREKIHQDVRKAAAEHRVLDPPPSVATSESDNSESPPRMPTPRPQLNFGLPLVSNETVPVAGQLVFACGVIPDTTGNNEPALIALFAGPDAAALQDSVKRAAKCKDLVHVDIFVGDVSTWLPLDAPHASTTLHHHPLRQATESQIRWISN